MNIFKRSIMIFAIIAIALTSGYLFSFTAYAYFSQIIFDTPGQNLFEIPDLIQEDLPDEIYWIDPNDLIPLDPGTDDTGANDTGKDTGQDTGQDTGTDDRGTNDQGTDNQGTDDGGGTAAPDDTPADEPDQDEPSTDDEPPEEEPAEEPEPDQTPAPPPPANGQGGGGDEPAVEEPEVAAPPAEEPTEEPAEEAEEVTEAATTEPEGGEISPSMINEFFFGELFPGLNALIGFFAEEDIKKIIAQYLGSLLVILAAINMVAATGANLFSLLPYLHLIFSEPIVSLFRGKAQKWGVAYDSLTKKPVDLAVIRLFNKENDKVVQTKVTDKDGRYLLTPQEAGKYYIKALKNGYNYPSKLLKDRQSDANFVNLHHGETIETGQSNEFLGVNIPLDPKIKPEKSDKIIYIGHFRKQVQVAFAYSGIVLSALSFALYPTFAMAAFTAGHVAMYQIFRRLGIPKPPKNWGKIFDAKTKKPLGRAIVRIFDQKFNRLLETQVTDMRGRYAFLVGQNTYDLTADLKGFEKQEIKSLDVKDEFVGKDIGLAKAK